MTRLGSEFFAKDALEVAPTLLGTYLFHQTTTELFIGQITEVEAYCGAHDPASHAYKGKTDRNQSMFLGGGHSYVYFIYGIHFCFNVVCGPENDPSAVLIRALTPVSNNLLNIPLDGPAKLTKALQINKTHDGIDLTTSATIWLESSNKKSPQFKTSPRIGISKNTDVPWRFYY